MKEREIEERIRAVLSANGWVEEKNHQTTFNYGRPDLHVGHPRLGEAWIEVKRPGGKLGAKQFRWMLRWHRVANIIVCDDPDQVEGLLMTWMGLPEPMGCKPGPEDQWQPWMTGAQKREVQTGRTPLDDALDDWT